MSPEYYKYLSYGEGTLEELLDKVEQYLDNGFSLYHSYLVSLLLSIRYDSLLNLGCKEDEGLAARRQSLILKCNQTDWKDS